MAAGPVALLYASPLIAWRIAVLATLVTVPLEIAPGGLAWPWHPVQLMVLPCTIFAVALRHRTPVVAWTAVLSCAATLARVPAQDAVTVVVLVGVVAAMGVQVRRRVVQRQSVERLHRALAEQRTLIARELHDVVGHHMSLIAVRAESASYRLHDRPQDQQAEFTALAGASREALNDMRCLVGAMATGSGLSGIDDVRTLVDRARASGLTVEARFDTAADNAVSAESALVVHRVVQEALSNAARHAPGSTIYLDVQATGELVQVGVRNTAATRTAHSDPNRGRAAGNGLTGMRRRVTALSGTFSAGPTADGGFRVDVAVPSGGAGYRV